jgi:hypothetical protein
MVTFIVTHEVKDFGHWKEGFEADEPNRVKQEIKSLGLYTSTDNSNLVTIIFEAPNEEAVNGMMNSPELKVAMQNAGVISVPEVKILNKV